MATPSAFGSDVVDNVDLIMAAHVNNLRAWLEYTAALGLNSNTETLTGDKTLVDTDSPVQYLDPGGSDRDVELPAEATTNHAFYVANTADADEDLVVSDDGASEIATVGQGEMALFVSDGTTWFAVSGGGGGNVDYPTIKDEISEDFEIPADYTMVAGPAHSIASGKTLTVNGTLVVLNGTGSSGGGASQKLFQARLTPTNLVAVETSEVTGVTTLRLTPYGGNIISLYDGSNWIDHELTEITASLAGLTASTPYDVFVYDSSGLTLELVTWTNANTRASTPQLQDGVYVKNGDATKRYVGTIRINSTGGQLDYSLTDCGIWNYYNRCAKKLYIRSGTGSHSYNNTTKRVYNNSTSETRVYFVTGMVEDVFFGSINCSMSPGSDGNYVGVSAYKNGTMIDNSEVLNYNQNSVVVTAGFNDYPALGVSYVELWERGNDAGNTFTKATNLLTVMA
jgi:hypothetical protein